MGNKELIDLLVKLCEKYPEQSFGELLFNYTRIGNCVESDKEIIADLTEALK